jgi:hypothetical protein
MDETRATPDPEVEAASGTPPPAEPVETPAPEPEADQSAAPGVIAQAEYTKATQLAAAIRKEYGLPKGATQVEVLEAIRARDAKVVGDDEPIQEEDPALTAERQRRITAELRVTSAIYGEKFTTDALAILNSARSEDADLEELFTLLAAFRDDNPATPALALTGTPLNDVAPAAMAEASIDLSEGDQASRLQESTPVGRRETGVVGAIRGLFEQAGAASRTPRA